MYSRETSLTEKGLIIDNRPMATPIVPPVYFSTAFCVDDLDELEDYYSKKGYSYIRTRNPNRNELSEMISYLENGEASCVFSSGMAAISTTLFALLQQGDHIVADHVLYGETLMLIEEILPKYGISSTVVDFSDKEAVKNAIRPNTKVLYSEVVTNPTICVIDVEEIAKIAHQSNALYVVDNTFTTSYTICPLNLGADVVILSLTKFANGHSDVCGGSVTASNELLNKIMARQTVMGPILDPFSSYMCLRSLRTLDVRLERQCKNAALLAEALDKNPYVEKVNYPGLKSHPQYKIAVKQFKNGFGAMLSFLMPEDMDKINAFMRRLHIPHYAMTLGGFKTSLSYPVLSSHSNQSREERLRIGITDGMMRVSVGMENAEELIQDFNQALEVFK